MLAQNSDRILIVDDEPSICNVLCETLRTKGYRVVYANNGRDALDIVRENEVAAVITDVRMPKMSGTALLRRIKEFSPKTPVIVITGYGTVSDAVEVMKQGAIDYIPKPFSIDKIYEVVERSIGLVNDKADLESEIITSDPEMLSILETVDVVAKTDGKASVIIQGESGTGKELIAREIHRRSSGRNGPFVAVNCAAMPESLLESELFGHEEGAFTGAISRRIGKFELAHGGTLLLDEILEMATSLQVKLLRVLQEGEVDRIGSNETVEVDVHVIATTNRNIKEEVEKGNFRDDLFYRLYVVPIFVPRVRKGDIPILVSHFLGKFSLQTGRGPLTVSREAMKALESYNWPGNVRELENLVKRAVMFCGSDVLSVEDFFPDDLKTGQPVVPPCGIVGTTLREAEKYLIMNALKQADGNKTRAAKMLGITTRTIRNKLRQYNSNA